jgi:hypothetical protein
MVSAKDMLKLDEDNNGGVNCSEPIIGTVYKYMRSICSKSISDKKIKLGGHNKDVEIDESLVAKVNKFLSKKCFIIMILNYRLNIMLVKLLVFSKFGFLV